MTFLSSYETKLTEKYFPDRLLVLLNLLQSCSFDKILIPVSLPSVPPAGDTRPSAVRTRWVILVFLAFLFWLPTKGSCIIAGSGVFRADIEILFFQADSLEFLSSENMAERGQKYSFTFRIIWLLAMLIYHLASICKKPSLTGTQSTTHGNIRSECCRYLQWNSSLSS